LADADVSDEYTDSIFRIEPQGSAMKSNACSTKMSVSFNRIMQCHNQENSSLK
jgi:hypothetical protein